MSVVSFARNDAVVAGATSAILGSIADGGIHLAIWRRPLSDPLQALAGQDRSVIDDIDAPLDIATLDTALAATMIGAGYDCVDAAAGEIAALAQQFATIVACTRLRLRLEVIETDACRRFHADHVTVRLLMTLAGAGTQWRRADSEGPVEQLAVGEVALFKGRLWAEEPAILHRSPPIAGSGTDRLLLAIDPIPEREASG